MSNIIVMESIRKEFKGQAALRNLTFQVTEGEIFGFLGPSGAGKTTTIKILTAQMLQSGGQVKVLDKNPMENRKKLTENIGVLSDTNGVYERLSVYDNLKFFANIYGIDKKEVWDVMERMGIAEHSKKEAKKLSKGMKQRLMLARCVLHKPRLLFLDEPSSSLDPATTLEVHDLLRKLNSEGTTIFLTTHNMEEADKLCNRVAFLNTGEIVEMGEPESLKLKYANDSFKILLVNEKEPLYVKNNTEGGKKIYELMEAGRVKSIHSEEPNLEKIFLDLTGRNLL